MRGSSHVASDAPCQDSCIVHPVLVDGHSALIIAVSDGAGSASRAEVASGLACGSIVTAAMQSLSRAPDGGIEHDEVFHWLQRAVDTLRLQSYTDALDLREYACTLLAAVMSEDSALFVQIGDGAIVVSEGAGYRPVFWPQSGEYANTTTFVTDDELLDRVSIVSVARRVEEVSVFTDGLQMLALRYATREAHLPFFAPLFTRLRSEPEGEALELKAGLVEWLNSEQVNSRTDDDKTLVLATRSALDGGAAR